MLSDEEHISFSEIQISVSNIRTIQFLRDFFSRSDQNLSLHPRFIVADNNDLSAYVPLTVFSLFL